MKSSLRGPCMILYRSLTEDLVEILVRWRSCRCHVVEVLVWKLLWEALGRLLYQDLLRSSSAAEGPFMTILWDSPRSPGMKILVYNSDLVEILVKSSKCMILCRFLWENLEEVLAKYSRCPCMISCRSLWEDLVEILLKFSSAGPCIKILKLPCVGACMKVFLGCW